MRARRNENLLRRGRSNGSALSYALAMGETTLRVATWNLWWRHGDGEARLDAIESTLEAIGADVMGLQEVSTSAPDHLAMLRRAGLHHVVTAPPADEPTGALVNAVASRRPVVETDWTYLDVGPAPPHRTVVWARLDMAFGPVDVFVTHLSHGFDQSALRQRQVAEVARFVADRRQDPESGFPPIVLGDLNAVPDSDEMRALTGRAAVPVAGLVFTDAWEQVGRGDGATYVASPYVPDSAWPDRRLDYVLVGWPRPRPTGNPIAATLFGSEPVDGVLPSDHLAVAVDLAGADEVAG